MLNTRLWRAVLTLMVLPLAAGFTQNTMAVTSTPGVEGYHPLIEAIYKELGYTVKFESFPPERMIASVNAGAHDALVGSASTDFSAYPNLMKVSVPLSELHIQVWVKKGSDITTVDGKNLGSFTVGQVKGARSTEAFLKALNITAQEANSIETLANMLNAGRFQVAIIPSGINSEKLKEVAVLVNPKLHTIPAFHWIHKKHAGLIPKMEAVIKAMGADGRLARLLGAN